MNAPEEHDRHHRRSIRLRGYDYGEAAAYFVTICTHQRQLVFGTILSGVMQPNEAGLVVQRCWDDLPRHYPHVELDALVVMPNHIHGVIVLTKGRGGFETRPDTTRPGSQSDTDSQTYTDRIEAVTIGGGDGGGFGPFSDDAGYDGSGGGFQTRPYDTGRGGRRFETRPGRSAIPVTGGNRATRHPLSEVIRAFKTFSAHQINTTRASQGEPVWQRNYWEHIVRNSAELDSIRRYIDQNVARWQLDRENPLHHAASEPRDAGTYRTDDGYASVRAPSPPANVPDA